MTTGKGPILTQEHRVHLKIISVKLGQNLKSGLGEEVG